MKLGIAYFATAIMVGLASGALVVATNFSPRIAAYGIVICLGSFAGGVIGTVRILKKYPAIAKVPDWSKPME